MAEKELNQGPGMLQGEQWDKNLQPVSSGTHVSQTIPRWAGILIDIAERGWS